MHRWVLSVVLPILVTLLMGVMVMSERHAVEDEFILEEEEAPQLPNSASFTLHTMLNGNWTLFQRKGKLTSWKTMNLTSIGELTSGKGFPIVWDGKLKYRKVFVESEGPLKGVMKDLSNSQPLFAYNFVELDEGKVYAEGVLAQKTTTPVRYQWLWMSKEQFTLIYSIDGESKAIFSGVRDTYKEKRPWWRIFLPSFFVIVCFIAYGYLKHKFRPSRMLQMQQKRARLAANDKAVPGGHSKTSGAQQTAKASPAEEGKKKA